MNVIDLCVQGLCMETATHQVRVSSGSNSAEPKLCATHKDEIVRKATEAGGIEIVVTPIGQRVA